MMNSLLFKAPILVSRFYLFFVYNEELRLTNAEWENKNVLQIDVTETSI